MGPEILALSPKDRAAKSTLAAAQYPPFWKQTKEGTAP